MLSQKTYVSFVDGEYSCVKCVASLKPNSWLNSEYFQKQFKNKTDLDVQGNANRILSV